jgi:hypothetical protein
LTTGSSEPSPASPTTSAIAPPADGATDASGSPQ